MEEHNEMKRCTKCGEEKSFSEFHKRKELKYGLHIYCKECYKKEFYNKQIEKDPEKFRDISHKKGKEYRTNQKILVASKEKEIELNKQFITHKTCNRCKQEKPISDFGIQKCSKDGFNSSCKKCNNESSKSYHKTNPEGYRKSNKKYSKKNKEKAKIRWESRDKTKHNKNNMNRYYSDPMFRIKKLIGSRIYQSLRRNKTYKSIEYLGCSVAEYKNYLEQQFLPEMTWENHGTIWEIDHIIPCASFDLTIEEETFKCFHYSNTQPLFKTTEIAESLGYKNYIGNRDKDKI